MTKPFVPVPYMPGVLYTPQGAIQFTGIKIVYTQDAYTGRLQFTLEGLFDNFPINPEAKPVSPPVTIMEDETIYELD